jgi:hypothetical protein
MYNQGTIIFAFNSVDGFCIKLYVNLTFCIREDNQSSSWTDEATFIRSGVNHLHNLGERVLKNPHH